MSKADKTVFFDPELFALMCAHLKIPSKQAGDDEDRETASMLTAMDPLLPTQTYVNNEIAKGIKDGKHVFFVLKCRQSGITTDGIALLQFLCGLHDGFVAAFISDNAKRLSYNRGLARKFYKSLSALPEWRQEIDEDNREVLSFKNGSAIYWHNANSDDEGGLGRGMGVMGTWGTELGLWKDEEGTLSLMSSLPERNPMSLSVFEGTARGPNLFKELYDIAAQETNVSQKAIFVGWWLHPWYEHQLSNPVDKKAFDVYWGALPRTTRDESRWVEGIRVRYGYEIRPTQISWWRQHLREKKKDNLQLMFQEYPPLEEDAWIYGGSTFIDGRKLSVLTSRAIAARREPRKYFIFNEGDGVRFDTSDLVEVDPASHYYDLVCYAEPLLGPHIRYALGCDPSHGANEEGDHACIEVLQCHSDKAIQVAEFLKREIPTYQLAWVILHLVGAYSTESSETHLNIEMGGGGTQVYDEIKRLQAEMAYGYSPKLARYFSRLSHYVYFRPDSNSGRGTTVHWETSWKSKPRMLHALKNLLEQGRLDLQGEELIKDCSRIQLLRDGSIEVPTNNHRVMAMGICVMAYMQLIDMDIGDRKEFLSTNMEIKMEGDTKILTPGEVLQVRLKHWKENLMAGELEEVEGYTQEPEWFSGLQTEVGEQYQIE